MVENTEVTEQPINWNDIRQYEYVRFDEGTKTTLVISDWILTQKQELDWKDSTKRVMRKYMEADVSELNGKQVKMKLRSSSIVLLAKLKPILVTKDASTKVKIEVVRTGTGTATKYVVTEIQ